MVCDSFDVPAHLMKEVFMVETLFNILCSSSQKLKKNDKQYIDKSKMLLAFTNCKCF